ncbi:hypothetical protein BDZ45DRAFT_703698 [Acephala macrosclerotiorum]|nr:hypothetical protein BDZ45DRAFT_703698 [Acephala macrosclerotiorum]
MKKDHGGVPLPKTPTANASITDKEYGVRAKAKRKAKHILRIEKSSHDDNEYQAAVEELEHSPAFNTSKFLNRARIGTSGITSKGIDIVQGVAGAIINPKAAIKARATRKTAAHDDLHRAEEGKNTSDDEETAARKREGVDQCTGRIEKMEKSRQNMRVAWVTARHAQRVRAVDAIPPTPFPDDSFFEEIDDYDFEQLPFDFDTLRKHVKRLIRVSAPLQTFISEIRRMYRRDDPWRTGRIMASYFLLWYISHIMTFFYGYVLYSTIMNFYYPRSLEALREGIERGIDRGATAFKVGELMDKHGNDDWLGPLMEELGPFLQVQVADLASLLESAYNFYHFRYPPATFATLGLISSMFLLSALTDSKFAVKLLWFILGLIFFICWPISSLYPCYRLLVSPFKWALWEVPNHPEACFHPDAPADMENSDTLSFHTSGSTIEDEPRDILSFGCTYFRVPGRLIVSTGGIRFVAAAISRSLPHGRFDKPYSELVEMSKRQTRSSILSPLAKVTTRMDKLELRFRGREGGAGMYGMGEQESAGIVLLENVRGRDKAFNAIVAFSGLDGSICNNDQAS